MATSDEIPMFTVTAAQFARAATWRAVDHAHPGAKETAIGGRFTWAFTRTSIGTVVKLACACGAAIDLSDYEDW